MQQGNTHRRLSWAFGFCIEIVVAVTFLYSAVTHLQNPYMFLDAVQNYRIVPLSIVAIVTAFIIVATFVVGVSLVTGLLKEGAHLFAILLLSLFLIAQLTALFRGLNISCGCFGASAEQIGITSLARTSALLTAVILSYLVQLKSQRATDDPKTELA